MQGGRGETRDGVSAGLAEEAHGAERVPAEERGGGAQGKMSGYHINATEVVLKRRFVTLGYIYYESTMRCFANHLKSCRKIAESLKAKCF